MTDRWEYRIVYGNLNKDQLNAHGAAGWELVTVTSSEAYILKRKLTPVSIKTRVRKDPKQ